MNYLFNNTSTFNDCNALLYEAMYEQSQMEIKILEAMIKADSLSRKYRAQGIYTEAAIQAFNEEADNTILNIIKKMASSFAEKVKKWWRTFKEKLINMISWFMSWLRKIFKNNKKSSDNNANTITIDYNKEVEWCGIPELDEYYNHICKNYINYSFDECLDNLKDINNNGDLNTSLDVYVNGNDQLINYMQEKFKSNIKIVKLKDIPVDSFNEAQKIEKILRKYISDTDEIISRFDNDYKDYIWAAKQLKNEDLVKLISTVHSCCMKYLRSTSVLFKEQCEKDIKALVEKYKNEFKMPATKQEMASILAKAAMYEFMTAVDNTSPIVGANDIKRFAAARLEATMDEINDVINQTINHNAYQS